MCVQTPTMYDTQYLFLDPLETLVTILGGRSSPNGWDSTHPTIPMYDTQYFFVDPVETLMTILGGQLSPNGWDSTPPPIPKPPMYNTQYFFLDPLETLVTIVWYDSFVTLFIFNVQCSFYYSIKLYVLTNRKVFI